MGTKVVACCILVCFLMSVAGCATIFSGQYQKLNVKTDPVGATATGSDGRSCTTPGVLTLDRTAQHYTLTIKKEGYKDVNITLSKGVNPWFFGNILIGGLIGIVVDMCTGAAYKFSPDQINEVLAAKGIDTSRLDTQNQIYVFVDLKEKYPDLDLSKLERIN